MELNPTWKWLSAKKYSKATNMGYDTVLSLCEEGMLPCVRKKGEELHKRYWVQYPFNVINDDQNKLLEENEKLKKENSILKKQVMEYLKL